MAEFVREAEGISVGDTVSWQNKFWGTMSGKVVQIKWRTTDQDWSFVVKHDEGSDTLYRDQITKDSAFPAGTYTDDDEEDDDDDEKESSLKTAQQFQMGDWVLDKANDVDGIVVNLGDIDAGEVYVDFADEPGVSKLVDESDLELLGDEHDMRSQGSRTAVGTSEDLSPGDRVRDLYGNEGTVQSNDGPAIKVEWDGGAVMTFPPGTEVLKNLQKIGAKQAARLRVGDEVELVGTPRSAFHFQPGEVGTVVETFPHLDKYTVDYGAGVDDFSSGDLRKASAKTGADPDQADAPEAPESQPDHDVRNLFGMDNAVYDINVLDALVADRPVTMDVDPALWKHHFGDVEIDVEDAMTKDLNNPVIVAEKNAGTILVDGWHRAYKAFVSGVKAIPAHVITEEELQSAKVD